MDVDALQTALREILDDPARVSTGDSDRNLHSEDMTFHAAHSPDVEADVMGELAVRRGVPADRVLRERRALTTWQNIRFSLELLGARDTVLVISTADHLPRARRIARFWGLDDARTRYLPCDRALPPCIPSVWTH